MTIIKECNYSDDIAGNYIYCLKICHQTYWKQQEDDFQYHTKNPELFEAETIQNYIHYNQGELLC